MQKADQYFNGVELYLSSWAYDHHECWHLWNWEAAVDERVKIGMYHAEQYKGGSPYKNDFKQFAEDWEKKTYDPGWCTPSPWTMWRSWKYCRRRWTPLTVKKHGGRQKGKKGSCKPRKGRARKRNTARSRNTAGERSQRQQPPAGGLWWALRQETARTANVLKTIVQPDTLDRRIRP